MVQRRGPDFHVGPPLIAAANGRQQQHERKQKHS
jgi:hypothetical protein